MQKIFETKAQRETWYLTGDQISKEPCLRPLNNPKNSTEASFNLLFSSWYSFHCRWRLQLLPPILSSAFDQTLETLSTILFISHSKEQFQSDAFRTILTHETHPQPYYSDNRDPIIIITPSITWHIQLSFHCT